jgi:multisubunit Na+/H+ antiporter MnhB subunit
VTPRFGGLLVAGWLAGIIVSLLLVGGYADIALRDFGLLAGAVALFLLASAHDPGEKPAQSRG